MENLNKDPGPVNHGCGNWLFIWKRFHPHPTAKSGCAREVLGQAAATPVPSQRGVCCSILMTKTRAGARSHYHTLICLKRAGLTIQSAGVHRNPVKAKLGLGVGGVGKSITKGRNYPCFLSSKTRAARFQNAVGLHQNHGYLHASQWVYSCIEQEAPPHCTVISPLLLSLSLLLKQ